MTETASVSSGGNDERIQKEIEVEAGKIQSVLERKIRM